MGGTKEATIDLESAGGEGVCAVYGCQVGWIQEVDSMRTW